MSGRLFDAAAVAKVAATCSPQRLGARGVADGMGLNGSLGETPVLHDTVFFLGGMNRGEDTVCF